MGVQIEHFDCVHVQRTTDHSTVSYVRIPTGIKCSRVKQIQNQ